MFERCVQLRVHASVHTPVRILGILRIDFGDGARQLIDRGDGGAGGLMQVIGLAEQPVGGVAEILRHGGGIIDHCLTRHGVVRRNA